MTDSNISFLPTAREIAAHVDHFRASDVVQMTRRPELFRVAHGFIWWKPPGYREVRFDLSSAKAFRDLLAEAGSSDVYFALDDCILALSAPNPMGAA